MTIHPTACGAAILLALGIAVSLRGAVEPPATQNAAEKWHAVLRELGSASFLEREAGQNALKAAKVADLPTLQTMAAKTMNPDAKARLEKRVQELQEEALLNPPPITLELNHADVAETLTELGQAVGKQWHPWEPIQGRRDAPQYTVALKEKSFAEVFAALEAQGSLQPVGNGPMQWATRPLTHAVVSQGFLFYPVSASYQAGVSYQPIAGGSKPYVSLSYVVIADPRLRILASSRSAFTSVEDSQGHSLPKVGGWDNHQLVQVEGPGWFFQMRDSFDAAALGAPGQGQRIAVAKGVERFRVVSGEQKTEVPDMSKFVGKTLSLGKVSIKVSRFDVNGSTITDAMQISSSAKTRPRPGALGEVTMKLVDGAGRQLESSAVSGNFGGTIGSGNVIVPPVKGVFTVVTKVKDLDVPFEFKDLPLP